MIDSLTNMNRIQNFILINNNKVLFSSIKMYSIDNINKEKSKQRMHSMRKKRQRGW